MIFNTALYHSCLLSLSDSGLTMSQFSNPPMSQVSNPPMLQVMQSLDALKRAPKTTMSELESGDCLTALHTLYSMTLTPIG